MRSVSRWPGDVSASAFANDGTVAAFELYTGTELQLDFAQRLHVRRARDWGRSGNVWRAVEPTYAGGTEER